MLSDIASLKRWWEALSPAWKQIFISNLELDGMFSPSDIEYVWTLETLDCSNSSIQSLIPIQNLTQLTYIDISNTLVHDVSPLSGLIQLEEFHACLCNLESVKALRNLPKLRIIDLSYSKTRISDLPLIGDMSKLKQVYLNSCHLREIYPLLDFQELEVLSLYFNPLSPLEKQILRKTYPDSKVLV